MVKKTIGWAVLDAKGKFVAPEGEERPGIMDKITANELAELENSGRQVIEIQGFPSATQSS